MQLEQKLYEMHQPMVSRERQTTYFVARDLESLSATVLYSKIKKGDYNEGVDSSNDRPTLKFYNYLTLKRFAETELGIQMLEESHKKYRKCMQSKGGITLNPPTIKFGS